MAAHRACFALFGGGGIPPRPLSRLDEGGREAIKKLLTTRESSYNKPTIAASSSNIHAPLLASTNQMTSDINIKKEVLVQIKPIKPGPKSKTRDQKKLRPLYHTTPFLLFRTAPSLFQVFFFPCIILYYIHHFVVEALFSYFHTSQTFHISSTAYQPLTQLLLYSLC